MRSASDVDAPLLEVRGLRREYPAGDDVIVVLKDIDLAIRAGEMVAIMGQSGSGKSTLMNILGCLDRPTAGQYRVAGRLTADLGPDELAQLRREHFGFIFQRYHLLSDLDAMGNVEVPAIYTGTPREARRVRARALLERLGLADRLGHRPGQLSGGQQQRVSIARALMNGGDVILADEPTGALDTTSGEEVMRILRELHQEGRTVIIVTHDPGIADRCDRVIELRDGEIVADRATSSAAQTASAPPIRQEAIAPEGRWQATLDRFSEAFRMALLAMNAHRMRTFLTMLGIIIGIASVVCVVALGEGSRRQVLANISAIGTNTLDITPGRGFGDMRSGAIRTLVVADADALAEQSYVDSVTPVVETSVTLRSGNIAATGQVSGVGALYFQVKGLEIAEGMLFDQSAVDRYDQGVVIDHNTRERFFTGVDAVGAVLLLGDVPARVVGVLKPSSGGFGPGAGGDSLAVYLPFSTVQARMLGTSTLRSITVRVSDDATSEAAESAVTELLTQRHGSKDFFIVNTDQIRQTLTATTETMTALIAAIAIISLIVGGIGVMNIMLVSVTERTGEIGVRIAVGARRADVLQQFLVEAVLVCLLGGAIGVLAALGFGAVFSVIGSNFKLVYSAVSIVAAFGCSTLIGVVFGYLPARNAARLDPVVALARD